MPRRLIVLAVVILATGILMVPQIMGSIPGPKKVIHLKYAYTINESENELESSELTSKNILMFFALYDCRFNSQLRLIREKIDGSASVEFGLVNTSVVLK